MAERPSRLPQIQLEVKHTDDQLACAGQMTELFGRLGQASGTATVCVSPGGDRACISSGQSRWLYTFSSDRLVKLPESVAGKARFLSRELLAIDRGADDTTGPAILSLDRFVDGDAIWVELPSPYVSIAAFANQVLALRPGGQLEQFELSQSHVQPQRVANVSLGAEATSIHWLAEPGLLLVGRTDATVEVRALGAPSTVLIRLNGAMNADALTWRNYFVLARPVGKYYLIEYDSGRGETREYSLGHYRPLGAVVGGSVLGMDANVAIKYALIDFSQSGHVTPVQLAGLGISVIEHK